MKKSVQSLLVAFICICSSCVQIQRSERLQPELVKKEIKKNKPANDINVYVFTPTFRTYKETVKYEAIGSNISSFDQVLNRIKNRARKDGCEALVEVKFYRQLLGNGKFGSSFPKIEAIGIRYTKENENEKESEQPATLSSLKK